jgi:hypothetical protein
MERRERRPSNTNNGAAVGVGVLMGVEVGRIVEVAAGAGLDQARRGSGWGGVLTHAQGCDKRISQTTSNFRAHPLT